MRALTRFPAPIPVRAGLACALLLFCGAVPPPGSAGDDNLDEVRRLLREGRYAQAEAAARRALEGARDGGPLVLAETLDAFVEASQRAGRILDPEVGRSAEQAVEMREGALGGEHPIVALSLDRLAALLHAAGEYEPAEALYRRALAIQEKTLGAAHPETAISLSGLARARLAADDAGAARELAEHALAVREKALGAEHLDAAESLIDVARVCLRRADARAARPLLERALAIRERALGQEHPETAASLFEVGWALFLLQEHAEARDQMERALRLQESALPAQHPETAVTLHGLGKLLGYTGKDAEAIPLLERALAIREAVLGPLHPLTLAAMTDLGTSNSVLGREPIARRLFEEALARAQSRPGPERVETARTCSGLAILLWHAGERAESRRLFERALAIREKVLGPEHPAVAQNLNHLGALHQTVGDYAVALPLHQRALAIQEKARGPVHPEVAATLNNIANLLNKTGRNEEAEAAAERALRIAQEVFGDVHPDLAIFLTTLGSIQRDRGETARAIASYERALRITEQTIGNEHQYAADRRHAYARALEASGESARAEELYARALGIRERLLGGRHPDVAESLQSLARLDLRAGRGRQALARALRAETILREHFLNTVHSFSEREALQYEPIRIAGLGAALSALLSLAPAGASGEEVEAVWEALVRSRALVLDVAAARHRSIADLGGAEGAALWRALGAARARLAALAVAGPEDGDAQKYQGRLRAALEERDRAERAVAERSASFRGEQARAGAGLAEIRRALPAGAALLAYARYEREKARVETRSRPAYAVFVVGPGGAAPRIVDLGPAGGIDLLVQAWRQAVGRAPSALEAGGGRAEEEARQAGEAVRRAIWDPLLPAVAGARQVFVVPDGLLHLVSVAALPSDGGGYLIEADPLIHYLSAERDMARPPTPPSKEGGILLVGGPDYDARPETAAGVAESDLEGAGSGSQPHETATLVLGSGTTFSNAVLYRGAEASCPELRSLKFPPLPSSRAEAEEVESLWRRRAESGRAARRGVVKLLGAQAAEETVKREASGRRILHLATHGFFAPESCSGASAGKPGYSAAPEAGGGPAAALEANPLWLAGLALAGANRRADLGAGSTEDGILTAEEIAALDLSGVEWAVLSACETGVGRVLAGEGVLGLRRAFEVAGARTLIMSLWSVEDASSREWMRRLYEERLQGASTAAAVRQAGRAVLEARRHDKRGTHPFFWGAFVAAGDWR